MEKLKSNIDLISKKLFNKPIFFEKLIFRIDGASGTTAFENKETGLLLIKNNINGYNVYLRDEDGIDVYAENIDEKTASVCAVLSYIEISVENRLFEKFGSFDYLDALDQEKDNRKTLSEAESNINEVFSKIGIKKEMFFKIVNDNEFTCFELDFFNKKVNDFISRGSELYAWEIKDNNLGQIISSDFTKFDRGIFQSISIALEKKIFLMLDEGLEKNKNNIRSNVFEIGF